MANKISDETIEYVGILAKLELSDEEKEQAKKDMEAMLTAGGFDLQPGFNCKWRACVDETEAARQFAYEFAKNL